MLDLEPAAREVERLAMGVSDDQMLSPTPCPDYDLQTLLAHFVSLTAAFQDAARKELDGPASVNPSSFRPELGSDWRDELAHNLGELVQAWRDPAAWEGMTRAGGLDLPASVTGAVALNELVVHGWDVARATGHPYEVRDSDAQACMGFLSAISERPASGPFGPVVDVSDDAKPIDKVIGLSGRDPSWTASS